MTEDIKLYVYTSCHFSEQLDSDEVIGNGGYGVVININGKRIEEASGGYSNTTSARMDIMAITEGIKKIKHGSIVTVFLTNGYVIDTLSKGWLEKWRRKGFKKKKHANLWKELDRILQEGNYNLIVKHSREIKHVQDFQIAEKLGKVMSGKKNLPSDLKPKSNKTDLFKEADDTNETNNEIAPLEDDKPILESICVDASALGNPGPTEYRGVDTKTGAVIFELKCEEGTSNIGEFLAIVHALALYKKNGKPLKVIYSDSLNAISWVRQKKCKTKLIKSEMSLTEIAIHKNV